LAAAWRTNRYLARFILIALHTGTRSAAVLGLRWGVNSDGGWVDLEHGLIYRRGGEDRETTKRRTPRANLATPRRSPAALAFDVRDPRRRVGKPPYRNGMSNAKIGAAVGATEAMIQERYGHHHPDHLRDVVGAVSGAKIKKVVSNGR
jgi:hypothetical protein